MLLFFFALPARAEKAPALAGWAEVDITPPLGIALGGRGGNLTPAKEILDPLFGQVLILQDNRAQRFVLVSLDLVGISHEISDRLRTAIVRECGLDYDGVVVNCSHTHSGPLTYRHLMAAMDPYPQNELDYFDALVSGIIDATRAAFKKLTPAAIDVHWGTSTVAVNRRGKDADGNPAMAPNPDGPIDEDVWVMKLSRPDGSLGGLVFSYACHPVICYGYARAGISAEFPGVARDVLRKRLGGDVHLQYVQGLAGNVRPRILADFDNNRFRKPTPDDLQAAGAELARDVAATLDSTGQPVRLKLAATMDRPFLARGEPPPRSLYEGWLEGSNPHQRAVARYWLKRYDSGVGFSKGDAWPIGLVRLSDDLYVSYLAGEPCLEWGPKIRRWLAPRRVVLWGYCQEAISYLPTEELLPEGGYEVDRSNHTRGSTPAPFAPGIHEAVRRSLLKQAAFIEAEDRE